LIGGAEIQTGAPFNAIVTLFATALVMVTTTRAEPPQATATERLPYGQLSRAAPVAVVGCVLSGVVAGTFYSLVPAWMQDVGIERGRIALFMLVAVLGGFAFQIPIGWLSGRFDRRVVFRAPGRGLGGAATLAASDRFNCGAARRLYVDPLPCLRGPRARPHAGGQSRSGNRPSHPSEGVGLHAWATDRLEHNVAPRH